MDNKRPNEKNHPAKKRHQKTQEKKLPVSKKQKEKKKQSHSPAHRGQNAKIYDTVLRYMETKTPRLMIPVINEIFGERHDEGGEIIRLSEHLAGKQKNRIADMILQFAPYDLKARKYHGECESGSKGKKRLGIRMLEYDMLIGQDYAVFAQEGTQVSLPASFVLYLRKPSRMPDTLSVDIVFADGSSKQYTVPVIKVQDYTKETIFGQHLFIFLPYYMLRYEEMFPKTEEDEALREKIAQDLEDIVERLKMAFSKEDAWQGEYVAGYMCVILDYLLRKYPKTNERMNKIMGRDQVITVPADTLIEKGKVKGRAEGRVEGRVEEKISVIIKKLGRNMPFVQIAREMEMEESDLRPYYDATVEEAPDYSMKAILKKLAALKIVPAAQ